MLEEWNQVLQLRVVGIIVPTLYENSVVSLQEEVVGDVVDDDCFVQGPADLGKVLENDWQVLPAHSHGHAVGHLLVVHLILVVLGALRLRDYGVLAVEPVLDETALVDLIDDPVRVLFHRGRENHDLKILAELVEELDAVGSDQEVGVGAVFHVMYERLIKIQHQAVRTAIHGPRRQKRRLHIAIQRQELEILIHGAATVDHILAGRFIFLAVLLIIPRSFHGALLIAVEALARVLVDLQLLGKADGGLINIESFLASRRVLGHLPLPAHIEGQNTVLPIRAPGLLGLLQPDLVPNVLPHEKIRFIQVFSRRRGIAPVKIDVVQVFLRSIPNIRVILAYFQELAELLVRNLAPIIEGKRDRLEDALPVKSRRDHPFQRRKQYVIILFQNAQGPLGRAEELCYFPF